MQEDSGNPYSFVVHPRTGSIFEDGEFVQRGVVLGLSLDSRSVVIAPVSGWLRTMPQSADTAGIAIEIRQHAPDSPPPGDSET